MQYRRLGDAGVKLSEIGLGGWLTFGNAIEKSRAETIFKKAFEVGINFFDTSNAYAGGKCESAWGELLLDKPRTSYVLATKLFFPIGPGPNARGLSRKAIMEQCHASLKRLKTDYIDLYQCHRFDPETPLEETVRAMDDLIHQGKILYWGFSQWTPEQIEACLKVCGSNFYKPKGSQPQYNAIERQAEAKVFPLCHQAGIGQVVFSPLAQGVLSGKYKPGQPAPAESRATDDKQNTWIKGMVGDQVLLAKVQKLEAVAARQQCSMTQLSLAWILRRSEVTSCIIGATRPQQVEENAAASGIMLDETVIARIAEILN
ncbi:aldo/keto reductase family protein [soil metagenome]